MLLSLHIENIAVIKRLDLDFGKGFVALTGETGAGKSVIIDSINLLLGEKADKSLIRKGESVALVSGLFGELSDETKAFLDSCGVAVDEDGQLFVQRTVSEDGKSAARINGRAVSLAVLRGISSGLVNIHGQADTNALADPAKHLEIIDLYAENSKLLADYRIEYSALEKVRHTISEIRDKAGERERLKEILEYQIKDIDSLNLTDGEEEELLEKKLKIKNREKIVKNSEFVFKALRGSEKGSVSFLLGRSITALTQLSDVIPAYADYAERLRDMLYQVDDISEEVYAVLDDGGENSTDSLNKIESRLDKIQRLKKKYGLTVKAVLEFRDKAKAEFDTLENYEDVIAQLEREEQKAYEKALVIAEQLHVRRIAASGELESKVKSTLEFLDMPKVVFFSNIKEENSEGRKILNQDGSDTLEFYISANRGADAQSISKIASGGELARIMLALKSVIAGKDGIPTLIFDEIDAGVSGKTARKIGIKMCSLAEEAQVLCVTHSAQIASLADTHYLIAKSDINGATETSICALDRVGRINELSRILGGINVTDSQRAAAVDMLDNREF